MQNKYVVVDNEESSKIVSEIYETMDKLTMLLWNLFQEQFSHIMEAKFNNAKAPSTEEPDFPF
jgi:hypothetical protein